MTSVIRLYGTRPYEFGPFKKFSTNDSTVSTEFTKGIADFCRSRYSQYENVKVIAKMYDSRNNFYLSEVVLFTHEIFNPKRLHSVCTTYDPVYLVQFHDDHKQPIKIPDNTEFIISGMVPDTFIIDCFDETIYHCHQNTENVFSMRGFLTSS